jgi:hypothetical protein
VMTADDDTGTRLSATHSDETPRYWNETQAMYARLLAGCPVSGADRRELARRLAVARMRLARYAVAEGRRRDAVALVARALAASPRVVAGRLRARA